MLMVAVVEVVVVESSGANMSVEIPTPGTCHQAESYIVQVYLVDLAVCLDALSLCRWSLKRKTCILSRSIDGASSPDQLAPQYRKV